MLHTIDLAQLSHDCADCLSHVSNLLRWADGDVSIDPIFHIYALIDSYKSSIEQFELTGAREAFRDAREGIQNVQTSIGGVSGTSFHEIALKICEQTLTTVEVAIDPGCRLTGIMPVEGGWEWQTSLNELLPRVQANPELRDVLRARLNGLPTFDRDELLSLIGRELGQVVTDGGQVGRPDHETRRAGVKAGLKSARLTKGAIMAEPESATSSALKQATEALLNASERAIEFQHDCSLNDRSDELLAIELNALARSVRAADNSVGPLLPLLVGESPPDAVLGFNGVCYHEVMLGVLKNMLSDVFAFGNPIGTIQKWIEDEDRATRCVSDWSRVRQYMADSATRINESGTLNATTEIDRLCVLVRHESDLALKTDPEQDDEAKLAADTKAGAEAANMFKQETETWTIRFDRGDIKRGVLHAKVLPDIRYLLQHQGEQINIMDLPGNLDRETQTSSVAVATSGDLEELLQQIVARSEELKTETNPLMRQELEADIEALRQKKNQDFDKFGNPRHLPGDTAKAIKATKTRVDRFVKKLRKEIPPELATHFDKHIDIDKTCSYTPEQTISWDCGEEN